MLDLCVQPRRLSRRVPVMPLLHLAHPRAASGRPPARTWLLQPVLHPRLRLRRMFQHATPPPHRVKRTHKARVIIPRLTSLGIRVRTPPRTGWMRHNWPRPHIPSRIGVKPKGFDARNPKVRPSRLDEQRRDVVLLKMGRERGVHHAASSSGSSSSSGGSPCAGSSGTGSGPAPRQIVTWRGVITRRIGSSFAVVQYWSITAIKPCVASPERAVASTRRCSITAREPSIRDGIARGDIENAFPGCIHSLPYVMRHGRLRHSSLHGREARAVDIHLRGL